MLKTKPLTQLLSQSISDNVSTALLFTPSGSLLATGTSPTAPDAKKARTHAALAATIWASYDRAATHPSDPDGIKYLTLELSDHNMHIQLVAPRVLLCLIGPRTRQSSSRSSAHSQDAELRTTPGGSSHASSTVGSARAPPSQPSQPPPPTTTTTVPMGGSLGILKAQAQGLVLYLERELKEYEMPEGL